MAFPATQSLLVQELQRVQASASRVRQTAQSLRDEASAGPVERSKILSLMGRLNEAVGIWNAAASVSGLGQYARDQFNDQSLDVVAEFTAMQSAASDLRDWIYNNFPKQGGIWLVYSYGIDGEQLDTQFTQAELAGFVTEADAFIATIS